MKKLVDMIINTLIVQGIIPNEDKEIYEYGLYQGIIMIINILTFILIGLFFKRVWEILIFLILYIPLRTYAGGYHARTQVGCYYLSVIMIFLVLLVLEQVSHKSLFMIITLLLSSLLIFILAPVEDGNKPLTKTQVISFKKTLKLILSLELILIVSILTMGYQELSLSMVLSVAMVGIMVFMGWVRNKVIQK